MSLRIHFLKSDKPREWQLADAVLRGAAKHGNVVSSSSLGSEHDPSECDVACFVGVKSRELFKRYHAAGVHTLMLDKGYVRDKSTGVGPWKFWRVAIDAHHPTRQLGLASLRQPDDRFRALGIEMQPWRTTGGHVLIAGSSAKYHAFYGKMDPTSFAKKTYRELTAFTDRSVVYRPKPSWHDAVPLTKARYSRPPETMAQALVNCWVTVTHGSNACFDSVIAGVPTIILGDGVALPISSTNICDIESPRLATTAERLQWLSNLAYYQWTMSEFASGDAWAFLGEMLYA